MNDYNDFLDRCEIWAEREFSAWMDEDADFEEPIFEEIEV